MDNTQKSEIHPSLYSFSIEVPLSQVPQLSSAHHLNPLRSKIPKSTRQRETKPTTQTIFMQIHLEKHTPTTFVLLSMQKT